MEHTDTPTPGTHRLSLLDILRHYSTHCAEDVRAARNGSDPDRYIAVLQSEAAAARSVAADAVRRLKNDTLTVHRCGTLAAEYRAATCAARALDAEIQGLAALFSR